MLICTLQVVVVCVLCVVVFFFFFQAEDGIRDLVRSRGLGDVYKRQVVRSFRSVPRAFLTLSGSRFIGCPV